MLRPKMSAVAILAVLCAAALVAWGQGQVAPADVEKEEGAQAKPAEQPAPTGGDQTSKDAGGSRDGGAGGGGVGGLKSMWPLLLMVGAFFLLYMWMGRGRRKEQHRRQQMLAELKRGDEVTTIGGILGRVVEVRDDEVTVKVDESGNVKMRFAKWAVRGVGELSKAESPAQAARQQDQSQGQTK